MLKRAHGAVVDWMYVEFFWTLETIMKFAISYGMWELEVEVVAGGVGNFDGWVKFDERTGRRGLQGQSM